MRPRNSPGVSPSTATGTQLSLILLRAPPRGIVPPVTKCPLLWHNALRRQASYVPVVGVHHLMFFFCLVIIWPWIKFLDPIRTRTRVNPNPTKPDHFSPNPNPKPGCHPAAFDRPEPEPEQLSPDPKPDPNGRVWVGFRVSGPEPDSKLFKFCARTLHRQHRALACRRKPCASPTWFATPSTRLRTPSRRPVLHVCFPTPEALLWFLPTKSVSYTLTGARTACGSVNRSSWSPWTSIN